MQQVQQRELPERMSWARALIFGVGFFFITAILIGQLPGYIYLQLTAATLENMERGLLALSLVCLGGFAIIMVNVLLFDPKPVISPRIFTGLGAVLALAGLALTVLTTVTGCSKEQQTCNQYFPNASSPEILPLLGGKFLWFQPNTIDFVMIGLTLLGVGLAMVFYSILAIREQRNPDRRDLGTTPAIRTMIIIGTLLLALFLVAYTYFDPVGVAPRLLPQSPFVGERLVILIPGILLGAAILATLAAFALRIHYLMRPVRKRTMAPLYAVGALGLAQLGALFLLGWIVLYPLVAWIHSWTFIGLGSYLTVCSKATAIPASCTFSQQAGYLIDTILTSNFFALLLAAVWAWKSHRNLVVIGSLVTVAGIAAATLIVHTRPDQLLVAMILCLSMLILAAVWTSVSRREFAVVGENNLGCMGQWLVMGTCLFIYLGAFAFFSIPIFENETEPNIPFVPGLSIAAPQTGANPVFASADAMVVLALMGILAAIQFYFLTRNRYKV